MKFTLTDNALDQVSAKVLVIAASDEALLPESLQTLDGQSQGYFSAAFKAGDFPKEGKLAIFSYVPNVPVDYVVICAPKATPKALRQLAATLWQFCEEKGATSLAFDFTSLASATVCRDVCCGLADVAYRFDMYKSDEKANKAAKALRKKMTITWFAPSAETTVASAQIAWAQAWMEGTYFTRDLGNQPANVCTPSYLAKQAEKLAKHEAISVTVLKKKDIEALKMGALLGVAQGSNEEPRFIIVEYKPKKVCNKKPIVLVGKGVTFDAGGISLKPAANMDLMKYDMGGAATVLGTLKAISSLDLPVHVVGLLPATENLPDGKAVKPGDIVTSMSGKTIEIMNTDAEGRLILCDALTYAEKFKPEAVVDMATLTGAVVVALGSPRAGLMGNDAELQEALFQAGEEAADKVWKLPLDEEYLEMMKSPFADLWNSSGVREAGSLTAGAFLSEFAQNYKWAHLDIAGVAWRASGANKGGTGRPLGLLLQYFYNRVAAA